MNSKLNYILDKYDIDYGKVINKCKKNIDDELINVVKNNLYFLMIENNVSKSNIENTGSIIFASNNKIKDNYDFLKNKYDKIVLDDCLFVLNRASKSLQQMHDYVLVNYGKKLLETHFSILYRKLDYLKKIEEIFVDEKLENSDILSICMQNPLIEEVKMILEFCKTNKLKFNKAYFYKRMDDLKAVNEICQKYNVPICSTMFEVNINSLDEIIKVCLENSVEPIGSVFRIDKEEIPKLCALCDAHGIKKSGTIFKRTEKEAREIISIFESRNMKIESSAFAKTYAEVEPIVALCSENNIKIIGSMFTKKVENMQESTNFLKDYYDESFVVPLIIINPKNHLEQVLPILEKEGYINIVKTSASILKLKYVELISRINYIKQSGYDIVEKDKFNSIFGMKEKALKKNYGITEKYLEENFYNNGVILNHLQK